MTKLVLVETISQHRVRYVVEVEDDVDHALDEVVLHEWDADFKEFSQECLGTVIISNWEIDQATYLKLFDQDNDYLKSWTDGQKLEFINKINYEKDNQ